VEGHLNCGADGQAQEGHHDEGEDEPVEAEEAAAAEAGEACRAAGKRREAVRVFLTRMVGDVGTEYAAVGVATSGWMFFVCAVLSLQSYQSGCTTLV
jgi:hypothetical protein